MASADPQQPNVLFVVADDLGAWALGCSGNADARTPVIDGLAAEGVRLENFFCTSPVCSPARASLLTGLIPSQHGVHDWVAGGHSGATGVDFLGGRETVIELLALEGYRAALVGKWHLGASDRPREGFVHWFAHERGGGAYYGAPMFRGTRPERPRGYLTDVLAEDAVAFLRDEAANDSPFWLSLHFTAPHHPWVDAHPEDLVRLYAEADFASCPQTDPHPWLLRANPEVMQAVLDPVPSLRGYFAAVTGMDRALGRVLAGLDDLGLRDSTLVVFLSDNGFNCGQHGIWGKGNGTYPQNMFDTSVGVPGIFRHPGRIPAGRTESALLGGYDVLPTLLDYLGHADRVPSQTPGRSFRSLLEDGDTSGPDFVVVHDEYGPVRMIRTHEYKLVHRAPDGPHELYHLSVDPGETHNVVAEPGYAAVVEDLRRALIGWYASHVDPTFDGADLPVTGLGQVRPLQPGTPPASAFRPIPDVADRPVSV